MMPKLLRAIRTAMLAMGIVAISSQQAFAVSQDDLINQGVNAYELNGCNTNPAITTGDAITGTASQIEKVKTIIGVAKTENLTQKAALIAIMTVFQESHFNNYGNDHPNLHDVSQSNPNFEKFPPGGGDHDSVGIFQQQSTTGWSTFGNGVSQDIVWQIMGSTKSAQAVAYSAEAFFGTPDGAKLPAGLAQPSALKKGLQNKVPNYNNASVSPGVAAQTVQVSAFPDAYNKWQPQAQALVNQYWDESPPVPLPIAFTTDGSSPGGTVGGAVGGATTFGGCATLNGSSSTINKILAKVLQYAWPDYRDPDTNPAYAIIMKPEYLDAINAAQSRINSGKLDYVGFPAGIDCGGFITRVMRDSGADPEYNKYIGDTSQQLQYLIDYSVGNTKGNPARYKPVPASEPLQAADIAVKDGHTWMYVGKLPGFNGAAASASLRTRAPMAGTIDTRSDYSWFRIII